MSKKPSGGRQRIFSPEDVVSAFEGIGATFKEGAFFLGNTQFACLVAGSLIGIWSGEWRAHWERL